MDTQFEEKKNQVFECVKMERKVSAVLKRPGSSVICYAGSAKEAPSGDEANLIARKQNQQRQQSAAADTHCRHFCLLLRLQSCCYIITDTSHMLITIQVQSKTSLFGSSSWTSVAKQSMQTWSSVPIYTVEICAVY